jgi:tellurite resistance protein TerC
MRAVMDRGRGLWRRLSDRYSARMSRPEGGWLTSRPYRIARRIAVAVVGSTVLLIGLALLVLPGPAFVVIPLGLGILAIEFAWARLWLNYVRDLANKSLGRK